METITLQQLQKLFTDLRTETSWDVDGEMLWGYFFLDSNPDKLMAAGGALAEQGYEIVGVFENDEDEGEEYAFVLHVEKVEAHTPETLHARNQELDAFAKQYELTTYDGMDVNPVDGDDDEDFGDVEDEDGEEDDIENLALIAAIEAIQEESNEATQAELTAQLQNAVFLLPISGEPSEEEDENSELQLIVCTDDDGAEFLPLFTDAAALKSWVDEATSAMAIDSSEAWDYVLSMPELAGAVINPNGASIAIPRDQVELLKKGSEAEEGTEEA